MRTSRLAAWFGVALGVVCAASVFDLALRAQGPQDVNMWASRGAIPFARSGAASVVLEDGRIVITGGRTADGAVTDSVIAFNPTTNEVTTIGRLLVPRVGHTATLIDGGRVLVAGGVVDGAISSDIEAIDLTSGESTLVASLVQPRTGHAASALVDGKVVIVGGTTADSVVLQSAEIFDPQTSTAVLAAGSLQVPRSEASATTLLDGRVLVVGGNDGTTDLASAELFAPANESFTAIDAENHLSVPRAGHTALLLPNNNGVLIAGGRSNGAPVSAADVFVPPIFPDPYTFGLGKFAPTGSLIAARSNAVSGPAAGQGFALVLGGGPSDAEAYRFATIQTDKDDYAPGERALITGSGWQPGEDVTLIFQEDPAVHDDYVLHVTADAAGNISWNQWAPEQHDLNVRFYLTAVDSKSHAQITFTDSQPSGLTLTPGSVSVSAGTSATYQVTMTVGGNGNACTVSLSVAYSGTTPVGTSASFAPNPLTLNTQSSVGSALTITTTNTGQQASRTQPGTYPFIVTATRGANCQGNGNLTVNGTLIVTTPTSTTPTTLTAAAATATYGGSANLSATLSPAVNGKTITFTLNGNAVGSTTTDASGIATLTGVSVAGINVGTYSNAVGASFAGDSVYQPSSGSSGLTVTKADATVTLGDLTQTYTGSALTPSATTVPANLAIVWTNAPQTGAGTYSVTATVSDSNYQGSANGSFVINKADQVITWADPAAITYGTALSATQLNATSSGDGALTYSPAAGTVLNAGTHTLTVTAAATSNYNEATTSVSLVVNKADQVITWADPAAITYGTALSATQLNATSSGDGALTYSPAAGTVLDAGTHTLTVSAAATSNYNEASTSVSLVVNKADATVTVTNYTGVYDGNPHGATGTAIGVNGEDLGSLLNLGASFTNAPGGTADWSFAGNGNYNSKSGSASIVISQANATITVDGYTGVYDGNAHGATGTATGVKGEDLGLLNLGASFTNAPGGTANWSFAGNENYNYRNGTANIVISKADQVIAWATPSPIIYGTPLSSAQLNATLTKGDGTLTYSPAAGAVLAVGSQTLRVTASATTNYNEKSIEVTLQVNPWYATGFYNPVTMGGSSVVNTVKGGSTVPLKFNLYRSVNGTELTGIDSISGFQVYPMSCGASVSEDPIDFTTTGGTTLRYDLTERQFIQNWQTPKGAGSCYKVVMAAKDGTLLVAFFKTK